MASVGLRPALRRGTRTCCRNIVRFAVVAPALAGCASDEQTDGTTTAAATVNDGTMAPATTATAAPPAIAASPATTIEDPTTTPTHPAAAPPRPPTSKDPRLTEVEQLSNRVAIRLREMTATLVPGHEVALLACPYGNMLDRFPEFDGADASGTPKLVLDRDGTAGVFCGEDQSLPIGVRTVDGPPPDETPTDPGATIGFTQPSTIDTVIGGVTIGATSARWALNGVEITFTWTPDAMTDPGYGRDAPPAAYLFIGLVPTVLAAIDAMESPDITTQGTT